MLREDARRHRSKVNHETRTTKHALVPDPAVTVESVTHRYGKHTALRDFSLKVKRGELLALLGPNGSGKTTLFRILSTLMPPSEGAARVFGAHTTEQPGAVRQLLGVVFQAPALDEALTVAENLRLHGALFGLSGEDLHERIDDLLGRFEVAERRSDRVETLSGGLRRRVDLARGLLHRPRLLLLDEPTAGLDPAARHAFWRHLNRLRRRDRTTFLVATHLMDEAERCDRVAILDRGRRVALGTPEALRTDLGERALWLTSPSPDALKQRIEAQFGLTARPVGEALQLVHEDAPALLTRLYDAFGDQIESATVRRPTLEDVFMARTGHRAASGEAPFADTESVQTN